MLIFDENLKPIVLENVHSPTPTEYFWVLDLSDMDFTIAPLTMLEQIIGPAMRLKVRGFEFWVPTMWNLLVFEEDTSQLDVIKIKKAPGTEFTAFTTDVLNYTLMKCEPGLITATDYSPEQVIVAPALGKHQMLCHPIGPRTWINVAPSDSYNKYLKNTVIGDIIG